MITPRHHSMREEEEGLVIAHGPLPQQLLQHITHNARTGTPNTYAHISSTAALQAGQPLRAPKVPCTSSIASWETTNSAGTMVTTPQHSIILGWTPAGNLVSYKTPQVSQTSSQPQRHSKCTLNWCRCPSPLRSPWRWGGTHTPAPATASEEHNTPHEQVPVPSQPAA